MKKMLCAALAAILLICVCLAGGCAKTAEYTPALTLSRDLPPDVAAEHGTFAANLYFVSEDGRRLTPEQRTVTYSLEEGRGAAAVAELIAGPASDKLSASIPSGLRLERIEYAGDVCNVYFSGVYPEDERSWLIARAALAATLSEAEGVESVNLFLNGEEPGYLGRELCAMRPLTETLDVYLATMQTEYSAIANMSANAAGSYVSRTVSLYFTDPENRLLVGRNIDISYDAGASRSSIIRRLVNRMIEDDAGNPMADSALPDDLSFYEEPVLKYIETGESVDGSDVPEGSPSCVAELIFNMPAGEFDMSVACDAIALSLTGCFANVSGVSIKFMDSTGTISDGGYIIRANVAEQLGRSAYLYFPDEDGTVLHRVERVMPSENLNSAYYRLTELFEGTAEPGVGLPGFTADDVIDVYVTDDIAVVNWSAGFCDKLNAVLNEGKWFPADKIMRMFVFSIVNTLCELPGVNRVWMLEDGEKIGMVDEMYLGNALMWNPGLVLNE